MLQPVAITFEDYLVHIGQNLGIGPSGKFIIASLMSE
jgi:hypothetical protein